MLAIDWAWGIRAFLAHFGLGFLLAWLIYLGLMRIFCPINKEQFSRSLWVGFVGAWVSIVIDVSHIVRLFGGEDGRVGHKLARNIAYVIAGFFLLYIVALIYKKKFKKEDANQILPKAYLCISVFAWAVCIIVHVWEDYALNWF